MIFSLGVSSSRTWFTEYHSPLVTCHNQYSDRDKMVQRFRSLTGLFCAHVVETVAFLHFYKKEKKWIGCLRVSNFRIVWHNKIICCHFLYWWTPKETKYLVSLWQVSSRRFWLYYSLPNCMRKQEYSVLQDNFHATKGLLLAMILIVRQYKAF